MKKLSLVLAAVFAVLMLCSCSGAKEGSKAENTKSLAQVFKDIRSKVEIDNFNEYKSGESLDRFYGHTREAYHKLATAGISAVEMEAATILTFAAIHGIKAAALMTVSDQVFAEKRASDDIIEQGVDRMIRVALEASIRTLS